MTNDLTAPQMDVLEAVIKERLRRILLAQDEIMTVAAEFDWDEDEKFSSASFAIADRYDIPRLALHPDVACECDSRFALQTEKLIRPWVRGKMSKQDVLSQIITAADAVEEYDYGWVFLDTPMGFYTDQLVDVEAINAAIIAIGSRKHYATPPEEAETSTRLIRLVSERAVSTKKFFQMLAATSDVRKAAARREEAEQFA